MVRSDAVLIADDSQSGTSLSCQHRLNVTLFALAISEQGVDSLLAFKASFAG
jgi:hypothetical protein